MTTGQSDNSPGEKDSNKSIKFQNSLGFGEGRKKQAKYFHYADSAMNIKECKTDFDGGEIDIPVPDIGDKSYDTWRPEFSFKRLWLYTGPGWLMSIAYLDPGNIESDLQAGAVAGYQLIWVLFWATVLGWALQSLSARLGVVTGKNLAQLCRYEYGKKTAIFLWIMTQAAIIGSDIQEVVGSSIAYNLLFGFPLWAGCLITGLDTFLFLALNSFGIRILEAFFLALIAVMAGCFGIQFFRAEPEPLEIVKGFAFPLCSSSAVTQAVGMIGAVIMPHNLFLHSALVQTRKVSRRSKVAVRDGNYYNTIESGATLFLSFIINLFVVVVFAVLFKDKPTDDIGLKDAGIVIGSTYGDFSKIIWGVGLLAAGQSSTMTGTLAGQYAMSGFLDLHWKPWQQILMTRSISLIPALCVALFSAQNFDNVDELLNVQQSVQLPFALLPLLFLNSEKRVMGEFALSGFSKIFFFSCAFAVIGVNCFIIATSDIFDNLANVYKYLTIIAIMLLYIFACLYLFFDYLFFSRRYKKRYLKTKDLISINSPKKPSESVDRLIQNCIDDNDMTNLRASDSGLPENSIPLQ